MSTTFNASTKAIEVADEFGARAKGKSVIVTGGNNGLGLETCRVLSAHGASVVVASRSLKNGEEAVAKIKERHPNADVSTMILDLSSLNSVKKFAEEYIASGKPLHYLVNNAGIMAVPKSVTEQGLESQFGVNHMGHFYLTQLLLPVLETSGTTEEPARVVNLSSAANYLYGPAQGVHWDDLDGEKYYNEYDRYGQSKLCNILFTKGLQSRMEQSAKPVISVAVHPGVIVSTGLAGATFASPKAMLSTVTAMKQPMFAMKEMVQGNKNIEQGTSTQVYATLNPDIKPGAYYADCAEETVHIHALANDEELINKLWDFSETFCKEKMG